MKNKNIQRKEKSKGFTFLEIMVVVAILALLAALIIPKFTGRMEEAKITKTVVQIKEIMQALELYKLDNSRYPTTEQGLQALIEKPSQEPIPNNWKGYFDKLPADSWKNPFIYISPSISINPSTKSNYPYEIISKGADQEEGTEDDIYSWNSPE